MAFLQVITRTFGQRPLMLERNRASLAAQTDPDWEQTIVVDERQRGCEWANANLATVRATAEYVWVLDDDDLCCRPTLVAELKQLVEIAAPRVIMVRAMHDKFGMLPNVRNWRQAPVRGNVGWSCYAVRADVWNESGYQFQERYDEDFWFVDYLWRLFPLSFAWHDVVAARYPQQSMGASYAS